MAMMPGLLTTLSLVIVTIRMRLVAGVPVVI
jgi:hypothetical protein